MRARDRQRAAHQWNNRRAGPPLRTRLSHQGRLVLAALAAGDGPLPVSRILACVRTPSTSLPVAQASLSRTLRRLWAAGLVELVTTQATRPTLTDHATYWRSAYARVSPCPDAAYQAYRRQVATDAYGSAAAYLAAWRHDAERPHARIRGVVLTPNGRDTAHQLRRETHCGLAPGGGTRAL
jgi:DNA-binding MarR family transcriptional regulator